MQQLHPCQDPEFARGVECTEATLPDSSVLTRRTMERTGDTTTAAVVLTHPDGTGAAAFSSSVALAVAGPTQVGPATGDEPGRPNTVVTRAEPPDTLGQLTDVVIAVDQATR
jgi:hypothetical protein